MKNRYIKLFLTAAFSGATLGLTAQTYIFTNCSATGQNGPSQAQVNSAYASTTLDGEVTSSNGIQLWTVPITGLYTVTAKGAQGGNGSAGAGGKGASITGDVVLFGGTQLSIVVGQQGLAAGSTGAGGGGSFVVGPGNNPIMIAGGGGGSSSDEVGAGAPITTNGGNSSLSISMGGTSGGGGGACTAGAHSGGGGGGLTSNGTNGSAGITNSAGKAFVNGAQGGIGDHNAGYAGSWGGFGGGGGACSSTVGGGGGGGYSGGAGGQHLNECSTGIREGGAGGGAYNSGTNQVNVANTQTGHGQVIITLVVPMLGPNQIGMASIDSPVEGNCAGTYPLDVTIRNGGNNQVTSAVVNWTINGGSVFTQNFSGLLDTLNGSGSTTAAMNLGNISISGNTTIKVWTSLPNGQNDTVAVDDTLQISWYASDPQIDLGNMALCDGAFQIVNVSDPQWASYLWDDNSTNPVRLVNTPGTYAITATDTFGCPATDVMVVQAGVTPVVHMGTVIEACDFTVLNSGTPNGTYIWNTGATTQSITVTESGPYLVTVTSEHGCVGKGGVSVTIFESPTVNLGADQAICGDKGEVAVLNASSKFASYHWSSGQTESYIVVHGQQGWPLGSNEFSVIVTDENGCTATDTVHVLLKKCVTGVNDPASARKEELKVFPNPASTTLTVVLPTAVSQMTIELADLTGRTLRTEHHISSTATLDLKGLAQGQYFVKVQTEQNTYVKPVIIQ